MRIDVHQHLWSEPLLEALERRVERPRARWREGAWLLEMAGEPSCWIHPEHNDPAERAALVRADGLDLALIAPSSPVGMESLPAGEAEVLVGAYHQGLSGLPAEFGGWGAVALQRPDPSAVDRAAEDGLHGVTIPAAGLQDAYGWERLGVLLERAERRGLPVFVHPGPAPWRPREGGGAAPHWWAPLTSYVAELAAAWHALAAFGREAHPGLRVVFAALAGGAPLHAERLTARGGPGDAVTDQNVFYEVSSYGPRAIDAALRIVGADQLVYGSDRPVADPPRLPDGEALEETLLSRNPGRLLGRLAVAA